MLLVGGNNYHYSFFLLSKEYWGGKGNNEHFYNVDKEFEKFSNAKHSAIGWTVIKIPESSL